MTTQRQSVSLPIQLLSSMHPAAALPKSKANQTHRRTLHAVVLLEDASRGGIQPSYRDCTSLRVDVARPQAAIGGHSKGVDCRSERTVHQLLRG